MNKLKEKIPNYKIYLLSLIVIIIDQISKIIVMNKMFLGQEIKIIKNFLSLIYLTNTGAAFSTLNGERTFIIVISLFCTALIVSLLKKEKKMTKLKIFTYGILIGGMISNLIDRIIYKHVIDFISFTIGTYKAPIFNIADICITCGVVIYLVISIINDKEEIKEIKNGRIK